MMTPIQQKSLIRNRKIEDLRKFFDGMKKNLSLPNVKDVHFSEHLAERMVDRKLELDKAFIIKITHYFMHHVFYKTTYSHRDYIMQFKGLKVGIKIRMRPKHDCRFAIVSTAFADESEYTCDEKIILK